MKPLHSLLKLPRDVDAQSTSTPVAVRVTVEHTEGSVPRDVGTTMVVMGDAFFGTIGGGHLEHVALAHARSLLQAWPTALVSNEQGSALPTQHQRWVLGPSLGQCCGGVVHLAFDAMHFTALRRLGQLALQACPTVAVFGGGHVGDALLAQLLLLDYRVLGFDSRDDMFGREQGHPLLQTEQVAPISDAVPDLPSGCDVVIMSFSHAEDLELVDACLKRQKEKADLGFIGLIGSASKWARFQHRLRERGHAEDLIAQVHCPIGHPAILGKAPAVIALAIAAQISTNPSSSRRKN
jgi:xanthine dehydrogenase accessory factor